MTCCVSSSTWMVSWPGLCAVCNNDLVFWLPSFFLSLFKKIIWFDHQAESGIYKSDTRNLLLNVGLWSARYPHASHAHGTIMEGGVSEGSKSAVSWEKLLRKYSLSESVGKCSRCRMWECSEARLFLEGSMSTKVLRATGWRLRGWKTVFGGLDVNTSFEGNRVEAWRVECMLLYFLCGSRIFIPLTPCGVWGVENYTSELTVQ